LSSPDPGERSAALLAPVLVALSGAGPAPVVLIDGPSGAGKSTLADLLAAAWPGEPKPQLARLDDIYPGWHGLDAAIDHLTSHVLAPRAAGRPAAWRRYDWESARPAEWHPVDPARPLIVEGCGALATPHRPFSRTRIWLSADDGIRKRRALERDGELFRAHWDEWQGEWEAYLGREDPERGATIRLSGTPEDPFPPATPQPRAPD
jgi:uridine kinase